MGRLGVVLKKLQVRDMVEQVLGKARTPPVARGAVGAHARHGPGGADPNHRRELVTARGQSSSAAVVIERRHRASRLDRESH